MNCKWEELTAPDFAKAVKQVKGVCILPIGVLERHGPHLPLGTDVFQCRALAERAAAREPAIVFPSYYFGAIHEAKHCPGTIAVRHRVLFDLLENVCEEIARNGLRKIVILNGHGGNEFVLPTFAMAMLEQRRDFQVYVIRLNDYWHAALQDPGWKRLQRSAYDWHGGETETSLLLKLHPELVQMGALPRRGAAPRKRLAHLPPVLTPIWWYADWPEHYAGDARPATAEKGEYLLNLLVAKVAAIIKAVKRDTRVAALEKEFFDRAQH